MKFKKKLTVLFTTNRKKSITKARNHHQDGHHCQYQCWDSVGKDSVDLGGSSSFWVVFAATRGTP